MEKPTDDIRMAEVFEDVSKNGSENYLLLVHPESWLELFLVTKATGHDKIQYFRSTAATKGNITVISKRMLEEKHPGLFDQWREQLEEREKSLMEERNEDSEE